MTDTELCNALHNCASCSDAGLLACSCEFYADWPREKPTARPWLGIRAESFRWGHRTGRSDACRRLWKHLTPEGRELATVIANEGTDAADE